MIDNKFLYFQTHDAFDEQLDGGNISQGSIAFIEDSSTIWTHGKEYDASGGEDNVIEQIKVNNAALTPDANRSVNITVPTQLSDLTSDSTHRVVTDAEKASWDAKADADDFEGVAYIGDAMAEGDDPTASFNAYSDTVWNKQQSLSDTQKQQILDNISAYSKEQVDEILATLEGGTAKVVSSLPTASADTQGDIYYVTSSLGNSLMGYVTVKSGNTYQWANVINYTFSNVGNGYAYKGVAMINTNPDITTSNIFYILGEVGTYTNMGSIVHTSGIGIALWNGTAWSYQNVPSSVIGVSIEMDDFPIANSQNAVKSSGLFEELNIDDNLLLSSYPSVRAFISNINTWMVTDNNYPYYGKFIPCNAGDVFTIKANAEYTSSYAFLRDNNYAQAQTPNYATGSGKVSINAGNEITVIAPSDANYMWVCDYTIHSNLPQSISVLQSIKDIVESMGDATKVEQMSQYGSESGIIGIDPIEIYPQKGILNDGTMFATSSTTAQTSKFEVLPNTKYLVSGSCPSDVNLNRMGFVCTDENGGVLDYCKPTANAPFSNFVLTTKSLCKYIYIFGSESSVIKLSRYPLNFKTIKIESIPQIYDTYKDHIETRTSIKILCFGSSWFMNTWWYLNKLIGSINGISCEIHSYYMAHAKMEEWIKFYNNDLTPFTGEPSRGASKNISSNGADWSITNYSSSGSYNAQSYRNDFYADISAGDWDIIAFQQGAQEAIIAEEWEAKEQLVSIIRSHCSIATKIAFNATWTPALKNYSGNYFPTISRSAYGKIYFQQLNTQNTKSFIADTGIDKISPNGALMSLMRADATLNTGTKDMADDGLHPNNGLPMLGLCSCFYETFVAPLINVSIDDITWIPTSSTQKASVSGTSFNSVSATQFSTIKAHIKKALSDRFIYYL